MSDTKKYKKDFAGWSTQKQNIESTDKPKNTKRGEVWWAYIGVNVDREQDGGRHFDRPIIILHRINYFLVLIVPLTSQVKNPDSNFYYKLVQTKVCSIVLLAQIRVISTKRLRRFIEKLSEEEYGTLIQKISKFYKIPK